MTDCVLVTGGGGLLGRPLVEHLHASGRQVVATHRPGSPAGRGDGVHWLPVDLDAAGAAEALMDALAERDLAITHLVHAARSRAHLGVGPDGRARREDLMAEFALDVVVPYELTLSLTETLPHRISAVVLIGSMYGIVAPTPALYADGLASSPVQYGVSKAALHHLTRELAVRLAPQDVRVNCVAFGGFRGRAPAEFEERYAASVPSGRMLEVHEFAGPVEFLLSRASSAVNGHVLVADGGWSIW